MITTSLLLIILAAGVKSSAFGLTLACPSGQQPCGSTGCYDPTIQGCINGGTTIQCINSCNGTCYSNSQYCYNNTKVCNNGELICNVQVYNSFTWFPIGLTCYNSSQYICSNATLCYLQAPYTCAGQCLTDYTTVCANNRTICSGFYYWNYYPYSNAYLNTCGPQQTCYDNSTSTCVNGTTICQGLNARLCGANCFNTSTQICTNGTVRCINTCNGTCYSNSQYCYNNTKVCNSGELVCNIQAYNYFLSFPTGLTCYNSSQYICSNSTLCYPQYSCGTQCLIDYNSVCANNRTICSGFTYYNYYPFTNRYVNTCGPQQSCYDNSTSICLNGTTVCQGLNARLCGTNCFNPNTQICTNGTVQCINTCNGTCYSNSQYCYNNTKVCNNGEVICNVQAYNWFMSFPTGLTCYNSSQYICSNATLCYPQAPYSCGGQCLTDYATVCANNRTICSGFYYYNYYPYSNAYLNTCGPQQTCYDNTTNVCLGNNGTLCPIGNQLCSGICYNPQSQYCIGGNNTIYCLSNPSSSNCPATSTNTISITTAATTSTNTIGTTTTATTYTNTISTTTTATIISGSCCAVQNCTTNADCCQSGSLECQCYRHNQTDVYGSCANPNITPICGNSCPVQGKCRIDSDCCKCQCAEIQFTDLDGQLITKKQCALR